MKEDDFRYETITELKASIPPEMLETPEAKEFLANMRNLSDPDVIEWIRSMNPANRKPWWRRAIDRVRLLFAD